MLILYIIIFFSYLRRYGLHNMTVGDFYTCLKKSVMNWLVKYNDLDTG